MNKDRQENQSISSLCIFQTNGMVVVMFTMGLIPLSHNPMVMGLSLAQVVNLDYPLAYQLICSPTGKE